MKTRIELTKLYKFKKQWRIKKARRVVVSMNEIINSELFKQKVRDFDFTDRRHRYTKEEEYREVTDNQEILDILMKGREQGSPEGDDYIWKLNIKLGRGLRQVGRREGNLIITQNWFFKPPGNEGSLAAHWIHEHSHVLGFHHDFKETTRRIKSIPYGLGTIAKEVHEALGL